MGCASSKQKRTKSLDDIQAGIKESAANGQINSDANIKKSTGGDLQHPANPIQIPGANKSFLAPDGIPFIDEDVEEEDSRMRSGKMDVNENPRQVESAAKISALVDDHKSQAPLTTTTTTTTTVKTIELVSVKEHEVLPANVCLREEEAAVKIQAGVRGFLDRKKVQVIKQSSGTVEKKPQEEPSVARSPKYDENTAATKIQANYKGYKIRKQLHNRD